MQKTTKEGAIIEVYVNFPALKRYKETYNANYIGVIAPGFSDRNIRDTAAKEGIVLIETEAICKLLEYHKKYPYKPDRIVEILFKRPDKTVITPNDIPSPTKLHKIIAKILSDIKSIKRTSFSSQELYTAYSWQGLSYTLDDIKDALRFLSEAPFVF